PRAASRAGVLPKWAGVEGRRETRCSAGEPGRHIVLLQVQSQMQAAHTGPDDPDAFHDASNSGRPEGQIPRSPAYIRGTRSGFGRPGQRRVSIAPSPLREPGTQIAQHILRRGVRDQIVRLRRVGGEIVELGATGGILPDDQLVRWSSHGAEGEAAEFLALLVGPLGEGLADLDLSRERRREVASGPGGRYRDSGER